MDADEGYGLDVLGSLGGEVERIDEAPPESGGLARHQRLVHRRADFRLTHPGARFLVELKTRFDPDAFTGDLKARGWAKRSSNVRHSTKLNNTIVKAVTQLAATPASDEEFRLVMVVARGTNPRAEVDTVKATLYGIRPLNDVMNLTSADCYYFERATFVDSVELDGVITVLPSTGLHLFPNPFSKRRKDLQHTSLYQRFAERSSVTEVEDEELNGAFVADCFDLPVQDVPGRLKYVQDKYSRRYLSPMTASAFTAVATVSVADVARVEMPPKVEE